jgi:aspartate aminotransferase
VSIARWYPEGTIISGGLSKWAGAGGWRLGTFLFPPELRGVLDAMAVVASESFTSVSAPIQHAAVTAFETRADIPLSAALAAGAAPDRPGHRRAAARRRLPRG